VIDVSGYGEGPEQEFEVVEAIELPAPAGKHHKGRRPAEPPQTNYRGDPLLVSFVRSGKPRRPWLLTTGAFILGMAGCAIGVPLCLTIVFAPVGIAIMAATCYPLRWLLDRHARKVECWENRDRPLDEDTVKPWELS
jgi:hypothetical protein